MNKRKSKEKQKNESKLTRDKREILFEATMCGDQPFSSAFGKDNNIFICHLTQFA